MASTKKALGITSARRKAPKRNKDGETKPAKTDTNKSGDAIKTATSQRPVEDKNKEKGKPKKDVPEEPVVPPLKQDARTDAVPRVFVRCREGAKAYDLPLQRLDEWLCARLAPAKDFTPDMAHSIVQSMGFFSRAVYVRHRSTLPGVTSQSNKFAEVYVARCPDEKVCPYCQAAPVQRVSLGELPIHPTHILDNRTFIVIREVHAGGELETFGHFLPYIERLARIFGSDNHEKQPSLSPSRISDTLQAATGVDDKNVPYVFGVGADGKIDYIGFPETLALNLALLLCILQSGSGTIDALLMSMKSVPMQSMTVKQFVRDRFWAAIEDIVQHYSADGAKDPNLHRDICCTAGAPGRVFTCRINDMAAHMKNELDTMSRAQRVVSSVECKIVRELARARPDKLDSRRNNGLIDLYAEWICPVSASAICALDRVSEDDARTNARVDTIIGPLIGAICDLGLFNVTTDDNIHPMPIVIRTLNHDKTTNVNVFNEAVVLSDRLTNIAIGLEDEPPTDLPGDICLPPTTVREKFLVKMASSSSSSPPPASKRRKLNDGQSSPTTTTEMTSTAAAAAASNATAVAFMAPTPEYSRLRDPVDTSVGGPGEEV